MRIDEQALEAWVRERAFRERLDRIFASRYKPFILFDDDPDGILSYVLLSRILPLSTPRLVRGVPVLSRRVLHRLPPETDLVIILDKPGVEPDVASMLPQPFVWIDHHPPATPSDGVHINPRMEGLEATTSLLVHLLYPEETPAWLALVGSIADHALPERLAHRVQEEYPFLFEGWDGSLESLKFDTPLARIIRLISFSVKGDVRNAYAMLKALQHVKTPEDILVRHTGMMREVWEKYERLEAAYQSILKDARTHARRLGRLLVYTYTYDGVSFTVDLANELMMREKTITLVGRPYEEWMIMSIRSPDVPINERVKRLAEAHGGTGGGHAQACGARIPEEHAEAFIQAFAREVNDTTADESRENDS